MRAFVAIALFLAACDTVNVQQYRIAGSAHTDTAKLKQVLRRVASQVGLVESTSSSRVPRTLVLYTQPHVQHFRVDMGARFVADDIVVDLTAGFGPTPRDFNRAQSLLTPALSGAFGSHLTVMPPYTQSIPVTIQ